MDPTVDVSEENRCLRRTMRDLVALSTLPAVWTGLGLEGIAGSLADVLLNILSLELISVRFAGATEEDVTEVVLGRQKLNADQSRLAKESFAALLESDDSESSFRIPSPHSEGMLRVAITRFGVRGDHGALITGSVRPDFPTEQDRLLLGVAANQTAIVVQRRRAEEQLREQQRLLRVTLASIGDAVIATDMQGRVTFLNGVAEQLTGWRQDDARNQPLEKVYVVLNEQTRKAVLNPVDRVLRAGAAEAEAGHTILIARDGSERPIDENDAPIREESGKLIGVVVTFRDVTEQRRAHRALREREQELRLVTDQAPALLAHCDLDGRYKFVNRSYAERFGCTPEELTGQRIRDVVGEKAYAHFGHYVEMALAGRAVEFEVDIPYQQIGARSMHCAYAPEYDESGQVKGLVAAITDVTNQKLGEAALRESEQRFALFMQHLPGLAWIKDTPGRYVYANDAAVRAFRTPREDLYGKTDEEIFPPETASQFRQNDRHALSSRTGIQVVEELEHEDGVVRYSLVSKFPLVSASGETALIGGMAIDITEQRRAEQALRQSEARFRGLMEQAPFSIQVFSPDGRTLRVNRAWEQLWGVSLPQIGDYNVLQDPQLAAKGILSFIQQGFSGDVTHVPAVQYDPNVTIPDLNRISDPVRWVAATIYPLKDEGGRIQEVVLVHDDITPRKRAEDALLEAHRVLEDRVSQRTAELMQANEFLKALLENVQTGVVACNADGVLTMFNGVTRTLHGLPDEPVTPEQWTGQYRLFQSDGETPMALTDVPLVRALQGERVRDAEMVIWPEGQSPRTVQVSGQAFFDAQGVKLGAVVSMHDITARKRAEEALLKAHQELERRVRDRTAEVGRANQSLREADRRKDEFLATLAHELRNPLAPIRNSLQILKMSQVDAETARQIRDMMERQVHHLVRLVDDLLDVSRVMRGKIELRREKIELASVVARAVETAQPLLEVQGHRLEIDLPSASLLLDVDSVRLVQVIGNLLTNAAKYSEANGQIRLSARQECGGAVLRVRDNGIGIAPEILPHVFELFVQADHSSTKSHGGLGIGLTLVKNLVEMHDGTVQAYSEGLGKGSEFVVRLPSVPQESQPGLARDSARDVAQPPEQSGHRLLVVDDNQDAANSLALLLRLQGHEVRVAFSGLAALEMTKTYTPDVIFLDIGMPGIDGYEAARRIREQPGLAKVTIAALTGWGQQEDRRRTSEAGFDHHFVKPPEPKLIESLLAELRERTGSD